MPCVLTELCGYRWVSADVASIVVDDRVGDGVGDDDLPWLCLKLYGAHEVVASGGKRRVLSIGRIGVLATCVLPWSDAPITEASVAEVLAEVVDGGDAHLARETVVDLT